MFPKFAATMFSQRWTPLLLLISLLLIALLATTEAAPVWPEEIEYNGRVYRVIPVMDLENDDLSSVGRLVKRATINKRERIMLDAMDSTLI
ncbi:hypothetical protein M3Y97_00508800 [Aphelenchoides bicaudatus]|nr:hypothetical protein M3Y97_00508800 [Aphelenchoides bicaudatus]